MSLSSTGYRIVPVTINKESVKPISGADRIVEAEICGTSVVVGINDIGKVGLYWPSDGVISSEILEQLDLYQKRADGTKGGGFFDAKGRVRAQIFKGVRSDGFWMPLDKLESIAPGIKEAAEKRMATNDSFGEDDLFFIGGANVSLGRKFRLSNPRKEAQRQGQITTTKKLKEEVQGLKALFKEHYDTAQIGLNMHVIKAAFESGRAAVITEKLHGTSGRTIVARTNIELPWWKRLMNWVTGKFGGQEIYHSTSLESLTGTRRTMRNFDDPNHYRGFWHAGFEQAGKQWLNKGRASYYGRLNNCEVIGLTYYYEIVGYEHGPVHIQHGHAYKDLLKSNKGWAARYKSAGLPTDGNVDFLYGNKQGESSAYVYRVVVHVKHNDDGKLEDCELSFEQIIEFGLINNSGAQLVPVVAQLEGDSAMSELKKLMADYDCCRSHLSDTSISEGFCLRFEDSGGVSRAYKYKGFLFKYGEGLVKDSGVQDIEEQEAEAEVLSDVAVQVVEDVTGETAG